MGSLHFVALAAAGYSMGIGTAAYELGAVVGLLVLANWFLPVYRQRNILTLPALVDERFGPSTRKFLSAFSLLFYSAVVIPVTIYTGSMIVAMLLSTNIWTIAVPMTLISLGYASFGGLRAVAVTDLLQGSLMLVGAGLVAVLGLIEVGGWSSLIDALPEDSLRVVGPSDDPAMPWTGLVIGIPLLSVWYWCTDQNMVQRGLGASSLAVGQKGIALASFLKLLVPLLFILPGLCSRVLFPDIDPNEAFPRLIFELLPPGILGLAMAALMSGVMSTLDSAIHASATLVAIDFCPPEQGEAKQRRIARITTTLITLAGLSLLPVVESQKSMFDYVQLIIALSCAPIVLVYTAAAFLPWCSALGAKLCLGVGGLFGVSQYFWGTQHFLVKAFFTFLVSLVAMALGSAAKRASISIPTTSTATSMEDRWKYLPVASVFLLAGLGAWLLSFS